MSVEQLIKLAKAQNELIHELLTPDYMSSKGFSQQRLDRITDLTVEVSKLEKETEENPHTSIFHCRAQHSLIGDSDKYTLEVLKKNPDCPPEIVEWAKTAQINESAVDSEIKCTRIS